MASKMMFTSEEYVALDGIKCPFCGSIDISADEWNAEGSSQAVHCDNCGKFWWDIYELKGYEIIEK